MSGRRQLMVAGGVPKELILEMGLDSRIRFRLSGTTFVADPSEWGCDYGGIGTHYDLELNYPELYFGSTKCYANGELWDLRQPLQLGFAAGRISGVELLESGREGVSVGEASGSCHIVWSDNYIDFVDDEGSSSRYLVKIIFE